MFQIFSYPQLPLQSYTKSLFFSLPLFSYHLSHHVGKGISIKGLADGKEYTDIDPSTLWLSDPQKNIKLTTFHCDSRFCENDIEHSDTESPKGTEPIKGNIIKTT